METEFAFLCDAAAETGGKIHALGIGWDTIYAAKVPVRHPAFSVVYKLRASVAEAGDKRIEVRLIDADGRSITPAITATARIQSPQTGAVTRLQLVMSFNNIEFPAYGDYSIHLVIEGEERARLAVRVARPAST